MKYNVVHISSSDSGGAGIAAYRLNKALLKYGVNSKLLCLHKSSSDPSVVRFNVSLFDRFIGHLPISYRQNKYQKLIRKIEQEKSYESITFPEAIFDISEHPLIKNADVINLHWVGGMLNYPIFFKKINKPIVWTLHDMNPFLGVAHYEGDYLRNEKYRNVEDKIRELKIRAYSNHYSLTVVNLCKWMYDYSIKSDAFKNRHHEIIPNSVNTDIFKFYDKNLIRKILQLPIDTPVIMFCSQSVANFRKGFDLLETAMHHLSSEPIFLVVGNIDRTNHINNSRLKILGAVSDERYMALLYSAADAFVLPSREDNLPNTMLESLCCGTPVISFDNGGMKDFIVDEENGLLVKTQTGESLTDSINRFLSIRNNFDRKKIAQKANDLFSPEKQAYSYNKLYTSILF